MVVLGIDEKNDIFHKRILITSMSLLYLFFRISRCLPVNRFSMALDNYFNMLNLLNSLAMAIGFGFLYIYIFFGLRKYKKAINRLGGVAFFFLSLSQLIKVYHKIHYIRHLNGPHGSVFVFEVIYLVMSFILAIGFFYVGIDGVKNWVNEKKSLRAQVVIVILLCLLFVIEIIDRTLNVYQVLVPLVVLNYSYTIPLYLFAAIPNKHLTKDNSFNNESETENLIK